MAKSKPKPKDESKNQDATPIVKGDRNHAVRAITAITGCGVVTAELYLSQLPASIGQEIADAEASGKRNIVVEILKTIKQDDHASPDQQSDTDLPPDSQGADAGSDAGA